MAKRARINPYLLLLLGVILLGAGFLMGPFPMFVFAGLAPAFALTDYAEGDFFWNKLELVLMILFAGYFCAHTLRTQAVVPSLLQAISTTIGFAAFTFTRQALGSRLGRIPLIMFLLTLEYLILHLGFAEGAVFLADAIRFRPEWVRWTPETGYLGISLWILVANQLFYLGALRGQLSVPWLIAFATAVVGPIIYSYTLNSSPIDRSTMLAVYSSASATTPENYIARGEWIPRTAAWVSALILVFAFVKSYIQKK